MTAALTEMTPFNRDVQYAAKKQAVILSAAGAFRRRGYHNTSMVDIAKSLGLTKAALYYYVSSKEEILHQSHLATYAQMDEILKTRINAPAALDKLEALYHRFVIMLTRSGASLLTDVNSLSAEPKAEVLARRTTIERKIIALVKAGQKDGSIRTGDARLLVFFFMGALNWLSAWYDDAGPMGADDIADHFAAQMRAGLTA